MIERLARWIAILFDSSILSIPIFLALGYVSSQTSGLLWSIPMLLIVMGIPLAYLLIGIQRGWVSDMELPNCEERQNFILVSLSSDLLALGILQLANGPHFLAVMILTYLCLATVIFTTSIFWKISMHMAGVGGFSTALVFVFGASALWIFLSLPLVAWSRLYRHKHTPAQLVAGAVAGIAVTLFVFETAGKAI